MRRVSCGARTAGLDVVITRAAKARKVTPSTNHLIHGFPGSVATVDMCGFYDFSDQTVGHNWHRSNTLHGQLDTAV